jgi:hypothetical protein
MAPIKSQTTSRENPRFLISSWAKRETPPRHTRRDTKTNTFFRTSSSLIHTAIAVILLKLFPHQPGCETNSVDYQLAGIVPIIEKKRKKKKYVRKQGVAAPFYRIITVITPGNRGGKK